VHLDEQDGHLFGCLVVAVILHEISHGVVILSFMTEPPRRAGSR
jgi:hypothetical protein